MVYPSVGVPVTFLLTAIISSLLTLLITYPCLTRGSKFVSQQQEKPVRDPVSIISISSPAAAAAVEMERDSNAAYGTIAAAAENDYEPMAP